LFQRKDTLLQEYKIRKKSNLFVDKRIGEKDASLTAEDKMIARSNPFPKFRWLDVSA
jgi:nucleolar protein 14